MLYILFVLSNIHSLQLFFVIKPLTFTCSLFAPILPFTLVHEVKITCYCLSVQLPILKLPLIKCTVRIFKFTLPMPESFFELTFVVGSIVENLLPLPTLLTIHPVPFIHPKWVLASINSRSIRVIIFPHPLVVVSIGID